MARLLVYVRKSGGEERDVPTYSYLSINYQLLFYKLLAADCKKVSHQRRGEERESFEEKEQARLEELYL